MYRILPFLVVLILACSPQRELFQITGEIDGLTYSIELVQLAEDGEKADFASLLKEADAELHSLWQTLNPRYEDSELAAVNDLAGSRSGHLERPTYELLLRCFNYRKESKGCVEFLASPLSALYGMADNTELSTLRWPEQSELDSTLSLVHEGGTFVVDLGLLLAKPGMRIDFAPVLQGYIIDEIVSLLHSDTCVHFRVRMGDVQRVEGLDPQGKAWTEDLHHAAAHLTSWQSEKGALALIRPEILATFEEGILHNFLDPRTGRPGQKTQLAMVTAPSAEMAQTLALALFLDAELAMPWILSESDTQGAFLPPNESILKGSPGWLEHAGTH
jgi:thiamine biosynthesis lipoprotein ApbE